MDPLLELLNRLPLIQPALARQGLQPNPNRPLARNPVAPLEDVPVDQALKYRPDWNQSDALAASQITVYRDNGGVGHFRTSFRVRECAKTFWTGLQLTYNRNTAAMWRMYIWFSDDYEYELVRWQHISNKEWTLLPSVIPAFFIDHGRIFIEIDIPDEPAPGKPVHVNLRLCGFTKLLSWHPRWDMLDDHGNRLLTWIPSRDSDRSNESRIYHPVYDPQPPFEPNGETLPRSNEAV